MSEPIDPREQFGEHGEWDALAVGWALSALDPEDEERFAEHLPGCARCTATVRESLYTVADLAYALPDEAPPASLKSRLMAAVAAEPRTPGAAAEPEAPAEPEAAEEWPLGEPHPGSPGYGIDWFARPARGAEPTEPGPDARPTSRPAPDDRPRDRRAHPRRHHRARAGRPAGQPARPGRRTRAGRSAGCRGGGAGRPCVGRGDLGTYPPPVGERRAQPAEAWGVDEPTIETRRPDLSAGDDRPAPASADDPRAPALSADERPVGDEAPVAGERPAGPERPTGAVPEEPDVAPSGYRGGEVEDREDTAEVVSLAPRRRRLARRVGIGVAAAAVLALIAGLLVSNVRLRDQQDDLRQVVAQREAAIEQLTANGPAKVAALTANGQPSPDRRATLVVRGDHIEIIVESLGPTTGDETYWLWTLRCDTPQPTDLKPIRGFTVTQSEFSVRDIGSDPGVASAPCFAISSEQGTATPKAPRQVVAVGQPR